MEHDAKTVVEMGLEAAIGAVLLSLAVLLLSFGDKWYSQGNANDGVQMDMAKTAAEYSMSIRGMVKGTEIVEFIIKYGASYEYEIILTGTPVQINRSIARATGNWSIWSETYLSQNVFLDKLSSNFNVTPVERGDEIYKYIFSLSEAGV